MRRNLPTGPRTLPSRRLSRYSGRHNGLSIPLCRDSEPLSMMHFEPYGNRQSICTKRQ